MMYSLSYADIRIFSLAIHYSITLPIGISLLIRKKKHVDPNTRFKIQYAFFLNPKDQFPTKPGVFFPLKY